jgi:hypothetical protein
MSLEHSPARQHREYSAFTVNEFCDAHRISRSKLYALWSAGIGPRVIRIGNKILISVESAAEWRRERTQASEPERASAWPSEATK